MSDIYECRQCGREISRTARVCRHCGYRGTSLVSIMLAATIALIGIAAILNSNQPSVQAPVSIVNADQAPDTNKTSTKSGIEPARQLRKTFAAQFEKKIYWNLTRQSLSHLAPYVQRQVREPACCLFLVR